MRTAYKVWSGVAAATFALVCVATAGGPEPTRPAAAAAPTWSPIGTVTAVTGHADLTLADGRRIHVPMLNGLGMDNACSRDAYARTARAMLGGKPVRLAAPPRRKDTATVVPAGHVQADVTVDGADYATVFPERAAQAWYGACAPKGSPTTSSPPSPSDDYPVVAGDDDDTNHRDGALTGGYCRKKWWC